MPGRPPTRGRTPRAESRVQPSEQRSTRPGSPPHRLLDPEGNRALEHITLHHQLGILPTQPNQLRTLTFTQPVPARTSPPLQRHPPTQRALTHTQIPSHLRNRLARLPDNPNRTLLELLIKLSSFHRRSLPSWRCLHDTRGSSNSPSNHPDGWAICHDRRHLP